jgi:peptidoglycan/LPS O-acetylase OafA/YrhL
MKPNTDIRALPGRFPELYGLRGTAIFLVLVYYYLEQQGNVAIAGITPYLQRAVLMGWSGVDLFSVLAGFLSTRNHSAYQLSFRRLERWDMARHGEFSEVLCLPVEREKGDLERLVRAGFSRPE